MIMSLPADIRVATQCDDLNAERVKLTVITVTQGLIEIKDL
jgi:hypothetical protein